MASCDVCAVGTCCSRSAIGESLLFHFVADESYALVEFMEEECTAVRYSYRCNAYLGSNLKAELGSHGSGGLNTHQVFTLPNGHTCAVDSTKSSQITG